MAQNMTLSGGNAAQNQYMNYYNQIRTQLGGNYTPVQAQVIAEPEKMQAQQIATPDAIQAERINVDQRTYGDYADEAASYLSKYLDNSIAARRRQTATDRAMVDVDANSRGFTNGSTWVTDAKLRLANQEAADIMTARNQFLGQVGEQAYNAMQNQYNRMLQADTQNAANALAADQFNANLANAIAQYNANALMNADEFNINNALKVAMQNTANDLEAQLANQSLQQYLEQLAWGWAGQMYNTNPVVTGGGGRRGGVEDNSGVSNASSLWDNAGGVLKGIGYAANALNNNAQNQVASAVDAVQAALAAAQAQASSLTPGSTYQSTKNKTSTVAGGTKVKQTK